MNCEICKKQRIDPTQPPFGGFACQDGNHLHCINCYKRYLNRCVICEEPLTYCNIFITEKYGKTVCKLVESDIPDPALVKPVELNPFKAKKSHNRPSISQRNPIPINNESKKCESPSGFSSHECFNDYGFEPYENEASETTSTSKAIPKDDYDECEMIYFNKKFKIDSDSEETSSNSSLPPSLARERDDDDVSIYAATVRVNRRKTADDCGAIYNEDVQQNTECPNKKPKLEQIRLSNYVVNSNTKPVKLLVKKPFPIPLDVPAEVAERQRIAMGEVNNSNDESCNDDYDDEMNNTSDVSENDYSDSNYYDDNNNTSDNGVDDADGSKRNDTLISRLRNKFMCPTLICPECDKSMVANDLFRHINVTHPNILSLEMKAERSTAMHLMLTQFQRDKIKCIAALSVKDCDNDNYIPVFVMITKFKLHNMNGVELLTSSTFNLIWVATFMGDEFSKKYALLKAKPLVTTNTVGGQITVNRIYNLKIPQTVHNIFNSDSPMRITQTELERFTDNGRVPITLDISFT